jgi:hypothetical protein
MLHVVFSFQISISSLTKRHWSTCCRVVERHLQTFSHREKKKVVRCCLGKWYLRFGLLSVIQSSESFNLPQMPDMLNWFGWCTWDAFYTNVTAQGVKEGLQRYLASHTFSTISIRKTISVCLINTNLSIYLLFCFSALRKVGFLLDLSSMTMDGSWSLWILWESLAYLITQPSKTWFLYKI